MSVTLSASLPKDDRDGMGTIAAALVHDPEDVHVVIAAVDCIKITTKIESGDVVPTARIRAVEAFNGQTADAKELLRWIRHAYRTRTGNVELPMEIPAED